MNATLPPPDVSTQVPAVTSTTTPQPRPVDGLVRPRNGRRIGGVCAAIADRYGWSRTTVRLVALLSILVPGPQVLAYVVAWIVIPGEEEATGREVTATSVAG